MVKELIKRKFPMLRLALKAQCGFESIKKVQSKMFDHTELKNQKKKENSDELKRRS